MILSCIIVNYGAASYAEACAKSVLAQSVGGPAGEGIEVIVVDNFVSEEERERVRLLEGGRVRVVLLGENRGYSGGLIAGLEIASGEKIAFLNPDLEFLPGSLQTLCEYLDLTTDVGAVTPRALLDEEGILLHPPHRLPGLGELALSLAWNRWSWLAPHLDRQRTEFALRYWAARVPQDAEMLTGCCLVTTRTVLDLVGPPDPTYPLYFEDSDWCRRVRRAKLRLSYHPEARLIHFYSVSANQGLAEANRKLAISRDLYFEKFYGSFGKRVARRLVSALEAGGVSEFRPREFEELGPLASPLELSLPERAGGTSLIQMAGIPTFELGVGGLTDRDRFSLSETTWRHMFPTRYYLRSVDPQSLQVTGAWCFEKPPPGAC